MRNGTHGLGVLLGSRIPTLRFIDSFRWLRASGASGNEFLMSDFVISILNFCCILSSPCEKSTSDLCSTAVILTRNYLRGVHMLLQFFSWKQQDNSAANSLWLQNQDNETAHIAAGYHLSIFAPGLQAARITPTTMTPDV